MARTIGQLAAAGALAGSELVELQKLSSTVTITAATLSAAASDNSYNDSGSGFVTAGFAVGQHVRVQGFTGNVANNIVDGVLTAVTASKLTVGGTDGDVIVDDAAGESVTITAWESVRADATTLLALAADPDAADVTFTPATPANWTGSADPGNVDDALDQLAGRLTGLGTASTATLDTDTTLAADSDTRVPSQKAIKAYADQLIAAADAMIFKGVIDCSANPNYPAADRGHTYRVSVAGKIGGASGANVEAGDLLLCLTDATASGDHATVGSAWSIAQSNADGAVIGPASATDSGFVRFDGTTGKLVKNSAATIATADLDADAVTNAKLANVATETIKGRTTSGTGDPEDLTAAQAAAIVQGDGLTATLAGFRGIPQNSNSANYTLVAADAGKHILHPSSDANARTFTIPANASVAFPVGTTVTFVNQTSQVLSIAITTDTLTLANSTTTGTRSLAQNGVATAIKVASTSWIISGAGLT